MKVLECFKKHNALTCKNHVYSRMSADAIELRLDEESLVTFTLEVKDFVVCSGLNFQVSVWGLEKRVIWLLPPGSNHCILLSDVFLDICSEYVYAISKTPHACNNLFLTACETEFVKLANTYRVPIFIVSNANVSGLPPMNVVIHEIPNDMCLERLSELVKKVDELLTTSFKVI